MYSGFNLRLDKTASIFGGISNYDKLQELGKKHLDDQKAKYEKDLKAYVKQKEIYGTKIQNEWFPQVSADIFISHSHKDKELACALAGWIKETFKLNCFIDSNVWGYSKELLEELNCNLSNKREGEDGRYLYDHQSCNQVSQHVNTMLSIALQKMIDKVEAVILLNTDNAVKVCSNTQMEKTYSPWIYSEIISTQLIRKKPLLAYRNYKIQHRAYFAMDESMQFMMHADISYTVSLKHLKQICVDTLIDWKKEYTSNWHRYEYALDALYKFTYPKEVENTKNLFNVLGDRELGLLRHAYSSQDTDVEEWKEVQCVWDGILRRSLPWCQDCAKRREFLNE